MTEEETNPLKIAMQAIQEQKAQASATYEEDEEDEEALEPQRPRRVSARRINTPVIPNFAAHEKEMATQAQSSAIGPSKSLFGKVGAISNRFPGAERFTIYKRAGDGARHYIKTYNLKDLQAVSSLEEFIDKYLKEEFGGGTYAVEVKDHTGKSFDAGEIHIMYDNGKANSQITDVIKSIVDNSLKPAQPPPDPIEQMRKLAEMQKSLGGSDDKSNNMLPMMMLMMQQQQQQRPAENPAVLSVLEKLASRLERLESSNAALASMPPMQMPPEQPKVDYVALFAAVSPLFVEYMRTQQANNIKPTEMMTLMLQAQQASQSNQLGVKDLIEIMRTREESEKPKATLTEQLETIAEVRNHVEALFPAASAPAENFGTALLKALGGILANPSIGELVKSRLSAPAPEPQRLPGYVQSVPQQQMQAPQLAAPPASMPPPPPPEPTLEERKAHVMGVMVDALPKEKLAPICQRLTDAQDHQTRLGHAIEALVELHGADQWGGFINHFLEAVTKKEKDKTLMFAQDWLLMMFKAGLLTQETCQKVYDDLKTHFDEVADAIGGLMGASSAPEAPAAPAPAPAAEAVAAAE